MNGKRFFAGTLACALLLLAGAAGLVAWADPLLTVGTLEEGETALFINERYEMAGLIRRQDYVNLVVGTSSVANLRASWFTWGLKGETLKVTFPDGRLSEFDTALDLAFRTHPEIGRIFFCLDPTVLIREDQTSELPEYLYNDNPLDDIQFYLNAESVSLAVKSLVWADGRKLLLDDAYIWDEEYVFSKETALASYHRPEAVAPELPSDIYLAAARKNMDVVCGWIEDHPDVRFTVWYPPYSVLYWDKTLREGSMNAIVDAVEYATGRLLDYDNVTVHSFLAASDWVTDLDNYTDHIHCSWSLSRWSAFTVMEGGWQLTKENYQDQMDNLWQFVRNYDYGALLG